MDSFFFGVREGRLSDEAVHLRERIAQANGCSFIHVQLPDGWRSWFVAPNRGAPFNGDMAGDVMAELAQAEKQAQAQAQT